MKQFLSFRDDDVYPLVLEHLLLVSVMGLVITCIVAAVPLWLTPASCGKDKCSWRERTRLDGTSSSPAGSRSRRSVAWGSSTDELARCRW
jgi:hypothetical protein